MPVDAIKPTPDTPTYIAPSEPASEPVTLRPATAADAPALALVGAATFLEAYTWMLPAADLIDFCANQHTIAAYAVYLAKPTTRITLAVTGQDVPVGYAMLVAPELSNFDTLPTDTELKRIYLFSRFRSAKTEVIGYPGIRTSQALLSATIAEARALGSKRLLLGTNDNNDRAKAFYNRNGFTVAGTRTFTVGSQVCSDLIFAKEL